MNNKKSFFSEWKERDKKVIALSAIMTIIMFLILAWIVTNVPSEANRAIIYVILLIVAAFAAGIDIISEKNWIFNYVDYGKNFKVFGSALFIGGILALLFNLGSFSLLPVFAVTSSVGFYTFLYVVIVASYVEEKFFRGYLTPTTIKLFNILKIPFSDYSAVLISSVVFGIFHWSAYGGAFGAIFIATIFSIITIFGNYYFKSRGFGIGLHLINNFIAVGGIVALSGLI